MEQQLFQKNYWPFLFKILDCARCTLHCDICQLQHNSKGFFVRNSSSSVGFCSWFGISRFYRRDCPYARLYLFFAWTNLCRWSPLRKYFARTAWNGCVHDGQKYNLQHSERVDGREFMFSREKWTYSCTCKMPYRIQVRIVVLDMSRNSKSSEMSGEILCFSVVFSDIGVPVFLGVLWWNVYAFFGVKDLFVKFVLIKALRMPWH